MKLFEYMSYGRAIICSNMPVLTEILKDGVNAMLCDPDDIDAWGQAIRVLQQDPDLRNRLGQSARQLFLQRYTWSARAENILGNIPAVSDSRRLR